MSKIALVVGHSPSSKGAVGNAGISEYEFNKNLIQEILDSNDLIDDNEYRVFYRDTYIPKYSHQMTDLHERIDRWGGDFSIEFHFNGAENPNINGHELLYCSTKGRLFAEMFDKEFDENLPNRDRNVKRVGFRQNGGHFCCKGRSIAVILEPFFASHQALYIKNGEERQNLVNSIVNVLNQL